MSENTSRRPDRAALLIALGLVVIGGVIAWSTYNAGGPRGYSPVGPKTVPFVIAGVLVILGIFTAIAGMRGDFPEREQHDPKPILWILGGLVIQMLSMKTVGFSIASGLLFALVAKGFGRGPLWMTIPVGIVFSFVIWFIFAKGLQLSLPAGPLERLI